MERCPDIEIGRVEVNREKSIVYNPEFKGVRLDIYAKDENNKNSAREVKASREMGARYMTFQELLKEERIEERRRIAKRMLEKGMDVEEIADCTRLTIEQVMELKNEQ